MFTFDWEKERIRLDETVQEFFNEFERIECLKSQATLISDGNNKQLPPQCMDSTSQKQTYQFNDADSWEFYVQKNNMTTWRREEEDGHYAYKGFADDDFALFDQRD